MRRTPLIFIRSTLLPTLLAVVVTAALSEENNRVNRPDYQQAAQYSSAYLRQFMYDTAVSPRWIGKTDQFWYSYRTSRGTSYYRVDPKLGTKTPLFDRVRLASQLMELVQKPLEPTLLSLNRPSVNDEGTKLKFVVDEFQYEYDLATEKLVKLGEAPSLALPNPPSGITSREEFERWREEQLRRQDDQRRDRDQDQDRNNQQDDQQQNNQQDNVQQQDNQQNNQNNSASTGSDGAARGRPDHRNYSPDRKAYVFAKGHNLFYVEIKDEKRDEAKKDEAKEDDAKKDDAKKDNVKDDEVKKEEAKKEEVKKDEAQKGETKTEEAKKDEVKKDDAQKSDAKTDEVTKTDPDPQEKSGDAARDDGKKSEETKPAEKPAEQKPASPRAPVDHDGEAIQLTTDGAEDYSFASRFSGFVGSPGTELEFAL